MSAKYSALEVASLFIQMANSLPNHHIDNLKLNKLCYYAQGWSLAKRGEPLFDEEIQAWQYGPVVPSVYNAYKGYVSNYITGSIDQLDESCLNEEEVEIITDVYINYGKYSSAGLIDMTHKKGTPWSEVYVPMENNTITQEAMKEYFSSCVDEMKDSDYVFSSDNIVDGIEEEE